MRFFQRSRPWIVGSAVVITLSAVAYGYYRFNEAMRCDYYTVDVILMVQDYVETHDGNWPSSWEDLEGTEHYKGRGLELSVYPQYSRVDFTLTSDQILEDPSLIYQAVVPSSGKYICYPDARLHLDRILDTIRRKCERKTI